MSAMLIDRCLPQFNVTQIEHRVIEAPVPVTWDALCALDLMQIHTPLMDAAFFVRDIPARVATWVGRPVPSTPPPPQLTLTDDGPGLEGWLSLGQVVDREIALGAIGRFWQPEIEWYDVSGMTAEEFAAFDEPGWGRIAANFSLRSYGEPRTLASYEARTATSDPEAARKFERYWGVIRPFVGHIMRAALDSLARDAERRAIVQPSRAKTNSR